MRYFPQKYIKHNPLFHSTGGYIQHNPLFVPRNQKKKVSNFCPRQDLASVCESAHEAMIYIYVMLTQKLCIKHTT